MCIEHRQIFTLTAPREGTLLELHVPGLKFFSNLESKKLLVKRIFETEILRYNRRHKVLKITKISKIWKIQWLWWNDLNKTITNVGCGCCLDEWSIEFLDILVYSILILTMDYKFLIEWAGSFFKLFEYCFQLNLLNFNFDILKFRN